MGATDHSKSHQNRCDAAGTKSRRHIIRIEGVEKHGTTAFKVTCLLSFHWKIFAMNLKMD
eukprot:scaffold15273_cov83-Skeletonema_marinoi.AAC.5